MRLKLLGSLAWASGFPEPFHFRPVQVSGKRHHGQLCAEPILGYAGATSSDAEARSDLRFGHCLFIGALRGVGGRGVGDYTSLNKPY